MTARQPSPNVQTSPGAADWIPTLETDVSLDVFGNPIYEDLSPSGHIENSSPGPEVAAPGAVVPEVGVYYGAFTALSAAQRSIDQGMPAQFARGQAGYTFRDERYRTTTVDEGPASTNGLPSIEAMRRGFNSFDQNNSHKRSPHETFVYDDRRILTPQRVHYATPLFPNAATVPQDTRPVNPEQGASKSGWNVFSAFQRLTAPPQVPGGRRVPPSVSDIAESHSGGVAYPAPVATDPRSYSETAFAWVIA